MYLVHLDFFMFLRQAVEQLPAFFANQLNGLLNLLYPALLTDACKKT